MPLRHVDIFDNLAERLRPQINPFVSTMLEYGRDPAFPLRYGSGLQGLKGVWQQFFAERQGEEGTPPEKIVLEIGMHKGRSLLAMGDARPDWAFVGLDITYKRVVLTAEKIQASARPNLCAVLGDARHSEEIFAPGELAGIVVFFPDPWSKKQRQAHNKLLNPEMCQRLYGLLAQGGFFWLKTDCARYFSEVAEFFAVQLGLNTSVLPPIDLAGHHTTFEQKFLRAGQAIHSGCWWKR